MRDDPLNNLLAGFIFGVMVVLFLAGIAVGRCFTSDWWERESVTQGHAEYVVGEFGESVWQWKEPPCGQ